MSARPEIPAPLSKSSTGSIPAVVRADFERAGFRLAATSDILANAADDHTKLVFDPAIRGKTDRFMMKFVKPR